MSIWAWGRGLTSWLIEHIIIDGGPDSAMAWQQLAELLSRTWAACARGAVGAVKAGDR